ncbi:serine hydrolase domain-containing protein [Halalkalibacillus halophilus]|uniref:serine hydrolase domain-containing protein n=1 Tax=Halalkalibacillus halophilus TaxID=392827 RepID=UPI000424BB5D|nr:serine hydrolase [Halalkalibacillus halophilus]
MKQKLTNRISEVANNIQFSGTVLVTRNDDVELETSYGYANRSEQIANNNQTRFGIASGCKLFTAIAICQLVESGEISFETKLSDCLKFNFPQFDRSITIHHLLTHTSGIPDYFDEEEMDDFEELWVEQPMYLLRNLEDFLPLFQQKAMKYKMGERFHYNNAGYILLGLIVEHISGMKFDAYIKQHVFGKAAMNSSGYFEFDALPKDTAIGYIDFDDGDWKTNIYSLPVKGGSDGGAFTNTRDMNQLWNALFNHKLLNETYTEKLLTKHTETDEDDQFYGYGIWIEQEEETITKYHVMGYDPGVSFHSAYYPNQEKIVTVCSNQSEGAYDIFLEIEKSNVE